MPSVQFLLQSGELDLHGTDLIGQPGPKPAGQATASQMQVREIYDVYSNGSALRTVAPCAFTLAITLALIGFCVRPVLIRYLALHALSAESQ